MEAPEVVGLNADGSHERLRWIPGDDRGVELGDDDELRSVGPLVRRVHDALSSFTPPAAPSWRLRVEGPAFIHGDISSWNVVRRDGRIVGLLDWDQCGPGRDLEDLAYAAWVWVPLEAPEPVQGHRRIEHSSLRAQQRRLRVLVDAYGLTAAQRQTFLTEVAYGQAMNKLWWEGQRVAVFGAAMQRFTSSWVPLSDALSDG